MSALSGRRRPSGRPTGPSAAALDARAEEGEENAENERNPEHVELLLLGPLGAADQETVAWPRRNEGNAGCNAAARTAKSPANRWVVASADRDSVVGMAKVRFRVLGSLEVEVDGAAAELGGARQRAVLAVLLVHANEPVATDRLVSESWGETAPATATKTAQVYVSRLRRTLGNDTLATTPGGYLLRVPQGALDTDELEELAPRARSRSPRGRPAAAPGLAPGAARRMPTCARGGAAPRSLASKSCA